MRLFLTLLLLLLLLAACSSETPKEATMLTSINSTKTNQHTRIEGTKTFLILPEDYKHVPELARYQKTENLYFQVLEMATSFEEAKINLSKEAIEATGAQLDLHKTIKVNHYDAIYFEGPSQYPGETKLGIWFGDKTFVASIVGVCQNDDIEGKKALIKLIQTTFYDKTFELDPFELANFTFEKDIRPFKFNAQIRNMFIFSPNGKADSTQNDTLSMITIIPLPFMTPQGAKNYTNELIQRYETQQRATFLSEEQVDMELNDQTVTLLKADIQSNGQHSFLFQAIFLGKESSLLFMGTCMQHNKTQNIPIFEQALKGLKFKE